MRYRFSPLERRGVIAGWRGGQIAVGGGRAGRRRPVPPVAARRWAVSPRRVVVAGGVALAFWPIRGRTGEQWLPLVVRWVWSGWRGRVQLAAGPGRGHAVPSVTVEPRSTGSTAARAAPSGPTAGASPPSAAGAGVGGDVRRPCALSAADLPACGSGSARPGWCSTARPGRLRPCWPCGATASPCCGPRDQDARIAAWARCWPRWPVRAPRSTGSSGSSPASPTTAARCGATGRARRPRPDSPAGRSYRACSTSRPGDPASPGAAGITSTRRSRPGPSGRRAEATRGCGRCWVGRSGAAPGPRRRRHRGRRRARTVRPGRVVVRAISPLTDTAGRRRPDRGSRRRRRSAAPAGRGRWPSARNGTRCTPTAPGTPPTGSPNGPGSTWTPDFLGPLLFAPLRRRSCWRWSR